MQHPSENPPRSAPLYPIADALARARELGLKKSFVCEILGVNRSTLLRWGSSNQPPLHIQLFLYALLHDDDFMQKCITVIENPNSNPFKIKTGVVNPPQRPPRATSPLTPNGTPKRGIRPRPAPEPERAPDDGDDISQKKEPPLTIPKCDSAAEGEEMDIPRTGHTRKYTTPEGNRIVETQFPKQEDKLADADQYLLTTMHDYQEP